MIRRSEHWSAFPLWLAKAIGKAVGGGPTVELIVAASLMVSVRSGGAIFGIVDGPDGLDGVVAEEDRTYLGARDVDQPGRRVDRTTSASTRSIAPATPAAVSAKAARGFW